MNTHAELNFSISTVAFPDITWAAIAEVLCNSEHQNMVKRC